MNNLSVESESLLCQNSIPIIPSLHQALMIDTYPVLETIIKSVAIQGIMSYFWNVMSRYPQRDNITFLKSAQICKFDENPTLFMEHPVYYAWE